MSKEKPQAFRNIKTAKTIKDIKVIKKPAKDFLLPSIYESTNEPEYEKAVTKLDDYKTKNIEEWLTKATMAASTMKKSEETFNKGAGDNVDKKYPILNNKELIKKITSVPITNNQKGRIRQVLKDSLQMSTKELMPDIINNKIQNILRNATTLENSDLRKLRILFNMLRNALAQGNTVTAKKDNKIKKKIEIIPKSTGKGLESEKFMVLENKAIIKSNKNMEKGDKMASKDKKDLIREEESKKGPKRYVVFLGNLPQDIDKDMLHDHFRDLRDGILHIRIPKKGSDKKTAIAYIEFRDELFYQLALSRHHSMLGNKRINVLYTTQKNSKVTQAEAKGKSAKIIALQKTGKLLGSVPLNRKRSQRRKKMKEARAKEAREA